MKNVDTKRLELAIRQWKKEVLGFEECVLRIKDNIESGKYNYDSLLEELEYNFDDAKEELDSQISLVDTELTDCLCQIQREENESNR